MPYEIEFDEMPIGYAAGNARDGEQIPVRVIEYVSTGDGEHFVSRMEGLPSGILAELPGQSVPGPSQIDHLLAIVRPDKTVPTRKSISLII